MNEKIPECATLTVAEQAHALKARLNEGRPSGVTPEAWWRVTMWMAWHLAEAAVTVAETLSKTEISELIPSAKPPPAGPR